jgi:hypothetical protein
MGDIEITKNNNGKTGYRNKNSNKNNINILKCKNAI